MILVTGASGNNGRALIRQLSARGTAVRGMVRRPDPMSPSRPGVEMVTADFDDLASIGRALEGVEGAFLVTNSSERAEERQLGFVEAARNEGVRHLVYLSQLQAARNSPVRFLRYHAVVEEAIVRSGIAYTFLRPNLFMQGLLSFRSTIQVAGRFFAPVGEAVVSVVDVRDIAAVAAAALTEPGHEGQAYDITGPETLTHAQMAAQLSAALGMPVSFVDITEEAMRSTLRAFRFPEWQAEGLIEDYAHYRRGEAALVTSTVWELTGNAARPFSVFARDYRQAFLDPAGHAASSAGQ